MTMKGYSAFLKAKALLFSVISRTLVRWGSYPIAEVQSVYSTAPPPNRLGNHLNRNVIARLKIERCKYKSTRHVIPKSVGIKYPQTVWQAVKIKTNKYILSFFNTLFKTKPNIFYTIKVKVNNLHKNISPILFNVFTHPTSHPIRFNTERFYCGKQCTNRNLWVAISKNAILFDV